MPDFNLIVEPGRDGFHETIRGGLVKDGPVVEV